MSQRKLYEVEAQVEARNWEKKNSDFACQEINQEFESFSISTTSSKSISGSERQDRLYGELELRNRLLQESRARNCQEVEELRSIC